MIDIAITLNGDDTDRHMFEARPQLVDIQGSILAKIQLPYLLHHIRQFLLIIFMFTPCDTTDALKYFVF